METKGLKSVAAKAGLAVAVAVAIGVALRIVGKETGQLLS